VPEVDALHAVGRDISEERESGNALALSQMALVQAQKMESIAKLTGGVAHDFNNVLQIISGNLQLLQLSVGANEQAQQRLEMSSAAVERGAKLASQLLAFARRQPLKPLVTDLKRLLRDIGALLRRAIGETIDVEIVVSGEELNTLIDPHQLEKVILNLALNARDAMDGVGKLTIELSNSALDEFYEADNAGVVAGQYVLLAISDTGTGIDQEIIDKSFEPFFTTKPKGEGTGLGLSTAYGFVKQSGGHHKVYSETGIGTTFKLYLPRSHDTVTDMPDVLSGPVIGGSETILVVEDDLHVQSTVVDILRRLGHAVLKASDGVSAMAVINSGAPIDMLFTDVVMPGPLRSPELARQAKQLNPNLAVLFTSGYTQNAIDHGGRLDPGVELISKPYRWEHLARKIRHLLTNRTHALSLNGYRAKLPGTSAPDPAAKPARRILLVEDQDDLRCMTSELLVMLGHRVTPVSSAEEALELLGNDTFDVLLTDLGLAGMSCEELAAWSRKAHPELQIIYSTGKLPADLGADPPTNFLTKPYTIEQLERALQLDLLEAR
jgi:CheY-like chemotaxis protein/nitrogen-specific signal transduction histidine kinase